MWKAHKQQHAKADIRTERANILSTRKIMSSNERTSQSARRLYPRSLSKSGPGTTEVLYRLCYQCPNTLLFWWRTRFETAPDKEHVLRLHRRNGVEMDELIDIDGRRESTAEQPICDWLLEPRGTPPIGSLPRRKDTFRCQAQREQQREAEVGRALSNNGCNKGHQEAHTQHHGRHGA